MLKGSCGTFQQPPPRGAAVVVVRPSASTCRRVLKVLQALPLQALHLAYEAGQFATYDVPAWARGPGRPSRVVVSSAASLNITVTE